jgi:hypothetical protein
MISLRVALIFALSLPAAASSPYDMNEIAENPEMALPAYLYEQFSSYSTHSSGSLGIEGIENSVSFTTGSRRQDQGFDIRAQCGVIIDGEPDDALHDSLHTGCEKRLLRTIKKLSQSAESGPYRAGGASEIEWQSRVITLVTSDIAYIVEGRYTNSQMATPCLYIDSCCSTNGALYLDSCREPTDTEWGAIDHCQTKGLGCRSPEYLDCLREQGVKAGCETQPDGSRICY